MSAITLRHHHVQGLTCQPVLSQPVALVSLRLSGGLQEDSDVGTLEGLAYVRARGFTLYNRKKCLGH